MLKQVSFGLVALAICSTPSKAFGDFSSAGATFLIINPGARAVGMGEAFCGLADDALATYYNPAGLAFQRNLDLLLNWSHDFFSYAPQPYVGTYYNYASASIPLHNQITIAPVLISLTDDEFDGQGSHHLAAGFYFGIPLSDILGIGAGVKYIYRHFLSYSMYWQPEWRTGNAIAVDIGGLIRVPSPPKFGQLSFGIVLQNIGSKVHYLETDESDPLPTTLRIGFSYILKLQDMLARITPKKLNFLLQWFSEHFLRDSRICLVEDFCRPILRSPLSSYIFGGSQQSIGIEITLALFAIRVGYIHDRIIWRTGWTWGLGFSLRSFRFNVAKDIGSFLFPTNDWRFEIGINDTPSWLH